ncbi:DUF3048 domain-containing protein [bacterium]|nr:DUF3048 domain-containing protein [bacterium]MDY3757258.1 DUF3048 domain-containing protein [Bacilli bacterium]
MKSKKAKNILFLIIVLVVLTLLGGGLYYILSPEDDKPSIIKKSTTTTTTKVVKIVNEKTESRPFAVMINNAPAARPVQSGLQDAYIVYEIIVEGGITRYMALFLDQNTARIGSIRSSRHYFLDYALENDAIYVHCGYSPQARADFSKLGVDRIEAGTSSNSWRDKELRSQGYAYEHTLFTSIEKLNNNVGKKRTKRNNDLLLNYTVDEVDLSKMENAKPANEVLIKYSNVNKTGYTYDAENKVYKRTVNGKEHVDYVTKNQYTVKNIITYQVKNTTIEGGGKGRQTIDNIGSGTGYYITDGYAVPITWTKPSRKSQTIYKYTNGEEIKFNDGNTFIQIQPTNQELTIN